MVSSTRWMLDGSPKEVMTALRMEVIVVVGVVIRRDGDSGVCWDTAEKVWCVLKSFVVVFKGFLYPFPHYPSPSKGVTPRGDGGIPKVPSVAGSRPCRASLSTRGRVTVNGGMKVIPKHPSIQYG